MISTISHRKIPMGALGALMVSLLLLGCGAPSATGSDGARTGPQSAGRPAEQAAGVLPARATGEVTAPNPSPSTAGEVLGLESAPRCSQGTPPTPSQTEGPYYKPNPPQRSSFLEPGMAGTNLVLGGHVLAADCGPVAGARVDFWQADDRGRYDNSGYRLRGYTLTDDKGRYAVETIVPGLYPGRTRHIHVKVQAPGGATLTTQLYFPEEPANARDSLFDDRLVMSVRDTESGKTAAFAFVVSAP